MVALSAAGDTGRDVGRDGGRLGVRVFGRALPPPPWRNPPPTVPGGVPEFQRWLWLGTWCAELGRSNLLPAPWDGNSALGLVSE